MSVMILPRAAEPAATAPAPDLAPLLEELATLRQQGRHLLDFLVAVWEAALRGTAAPSLLPTPPGAERLPVPGSETAPS